MPDIECIRNKVIYIVGETGFEWAVAFKCPCGCGDLIHLNLLQEASPSWQINFDKMGRISLSPSIERIVRCKSHFTLIKGMVVWH